MMRKETKVYFRSVSCVMLLVLFFSLLLTAPITASAVVLDKSDVKGIWLGKVTTEIVTFTGSENAKRELEESLKQAESREQKMEFSVNANNQLELVSSAGVGFRETVNLAPNGRVTGQHTKSISRGDSGFIAVHDIAGQFDTRDGILVLNMKITVTSKSVSSGKEENRKFIYNYTMTNSASIETGASTPAEVQKPAEAEEKVIPVESIAIEPGLFFLKIGGERQLNVKIKPPGANAADVIVKSYDSKVIDIYLNAKVKGLTAGYSEIVAATRDGKIQAKSRVFVGEGKEVVGLVLGNLWSKTKEFLAGESFQVKTPNATCGVRG